MSVFYTPSDQFIYVSPYFQNKFTFGSGTKDDVRICRYLNNILKLFGEDSTLAGGRVQSYSVNSSTFEATVNEGRLIQDMTLIEFPDFTLNKDVTGQFGDNAEVVAEKTKTAINADSHFTATRSGSTIRVTDTSSGHHGNTTDVNTGFNFTIIQEGVTAISEISQIYCNAASSLVGGEYFEITTPSINYYAWYQLGTHAERTRIDYIGGLTGGEYFNISSTNDDYYVWYRVAGTGSDPGDPARTGIVIDVAAGNTASVIQAATEAVLNSHADFGIAISGSGYSEILVSLKGSVSDATPQTSGFTVSIMIQGITAGSDPAIGGRTGKSIFLQDNDISYDVAQKTAQTLGSLGDFSGSFGTNIATITNASPGAVDDIIDGDTGFSVSVSQQGVTGIQEIIDIECKAACDFDSGSYFLLNSFAQNFYVWYDTNGISSNPSIGGRTAIEVTPTRSKIVIIYTDFEYTDDDRDVPVDPCTFFFKIGFIDPVTGSFIGGSWIADRNKIMVCAYDLDKEIFLTELNIEGSTYKKLGLDGEYNYFDLIDGGTV